MRTASPAFQVRADILGIDPIDPNIRTDNLVGLLVQKSGRTTGVTQSTIDGIAGTVNVTYTDEV